MKWKDIISKYMKQNRLLRIELKKEEKHKPKKYFYGYTTDIFDTHFIIKNDRTGEDTVIDYQDISMISSGHVED
jgi:hypothetical protein